MLYMVEIHRWNIESCPWENTIRKTIDIWEIKNYLLTDKNRRNQKNRQKGKEGHREKGKLLEKIIIKDAEKKNPNIVSIKKN